jgi:integrase
MKLTTSEIARYSPPAGKRDHIIFDETLPGFGLRYRNGKRIWLFQYARGSGASRKNGRLQFGDFPNLSPAKARAIAAELAARVRLGEDPAAAKRIKAIESQNTFGNLVRGYLDQKRGEVRPRTYANIVRYLDAYSKQLHALPASAVDLKRIAAHLDALAKKNGPVSANRARTNLSAMFSWAMRRGLHDSNPVAVTEARPERSRDRVLTDEELVAIWNTVGNGEFGQAVKLLILTGQRESEIGGLGWSEVDFERGVISLPAERTKNGRAHEIPMSPAVAGILQVRSRGRERVFGSTDKGFQGWGKAKCQLDQTLATKLGKPLPRWVIHDLRRTAATRMIDLGEQPHVVEAILNHVSGHKAGVAGIYNRSLYKAEKAKALGVWAEHILAIARGDKGSNIASMHRFKKLN